ncbi:MAG: multidrug efflux SMR transporter [Pseudomonadota bacterium]
MGYVYLAIAIVSEVIATTSLKASDGFSHPIPSTIVIIGYSASFYFLALVLKTIPVGVAYAIWAGLGIVLVALLAAVVYRQIPDLPALLGMGLIISGVMVIHLFSKTVEAV